MAEELREVIIRIAIEEGGAKIRIAELDQLAEKLQLVADAHEEYQKKTEESTEATGKWDKAVAAASGTMGSSVLNKLKEFATSAEGGSLAFAGVAKALGRLGTFTPAGLAVMGTRAVGIGAIAYYKDIEEQANRKGEELERMIARKRAGKPVYVNPFEPSKRGTFPDDIKAAMLAEEAKADARFSRRIDTAPSRFAHVDAMRQLHAIRDPSLGWQLNVLDEERKGLRSMSDERQELGDFGVNALRKEEVIGQRLKEVEWQRFDILQQQGEQLRQNLATQQSAVKAAEDAVKAERQRLQSLDEIVGRLHPEEFEELKGILDKVQAGGKLTLQELTRGEQLGGEGFRPFAKTQLIERGQALGGGAEVFAPVLGRPQRGEGSEIERLKQVIRSEERIADDMNAVLDEYTLETVNQYDRLVKAVEEAFKLATRAAERAVSRLEAQNADRQRNQGATH